MRTYNLLFIGDVMTEFLKRKHKIVLSDYNYQRDIENRLLMAEMTIFEVNVLREIVDGSLKIPIKQLANHLDVSQKELLPVLEKLSKTKLLEYNHETICVDKEMRKYFESEVLKFDDTFEPDMEFLQGLLSKVPIHVLPSWYLISRSSNHIFKSIIDEYLITPKIYQHYLNDLHFDDPIIWRFIPAEIITHLILRIPSQFFHILTTPKTLRNI